MAARSLLNAAAPLPGEAASNGGGGERPLPARRLASARRGVKEPSPRQEALVGRSGARRMTAPPERLTGGAGMQRRAPPETPGRVENPFESPGDVRRLQEQTVCSPSAFRATPPAGSPGRFMWSIDELALMDPVEINSEDIHRQAFYLSQSRIDREVEEQRQKAIEEFFTKSTIVPSPWTDPIGKQASQLNSTRCVDLNDASPVGREIVVQPGKNNAACQTVLSLPVDFDLEKILGDHFKAEESADQSQESLSTSSLRRKLFLDENGSLSSENVSPSPSLRNSPASLGVLCSIDLSPVRCRSPLSSSSSGQLSSSPIRGNARTYSLGSLPSPSLASPIFSPVGIQLRKTPLADQRQFTFRSPDLPSVSNACRQAPTSGRSPYVECSPLRSLSPARLLSSSYWGAALYQSSLLRLPCTPENFQEELAEAAEATSVESPRAGLTPVNEDIPSAGSHFEMAAVSPSLDLPETCPKGLAPKPCLDSPRKERTVEMADPEMLDENSVKGSAECDQGAMAGLSMEGSCICMAPLAESSASPCDSSSLQMDSGYNTQAHTSSLMDTAGSELSCREHGAFEAQRKPQISRTKQGKWILG
ncbi:protein aurora borealis isoform X1 [Crotalus tigris]|uniref:protein aurora borealis isoform X1 n=1 Tax=Crotalus tigris TaxID=88082 RepID=UPI00192F3E06|nr:protein aurora borealis isoform X1 [Crotalus tigris]